MEIRPPMQQSDNLSRALLLLILICLVIVILRPTGESEPTPAVVATTGPMQCR